MQPFAIDPDIRRAQTLPAEVYASPAWYAVQKERVFARSWQMVRGAERVKAPGHLLPFTLLEGCLDEPLVLAAGEDGLTRCLSNVCTHRGTVVCEGETHARHLRCRYHGRRFALDGTMTHMPEFDGVEDFPSEADNLPRVPLEQWGPLAFTALDPACSFDEWMGPIRERVRLSAAGRVHVRSGHLARLPDPRQLGAVRGQLPGGVPRPLHPRLARARRWTTPPTARRPTTGATCSWAPRRTATRRSCSPPGTRTRGADRGVLLVAVPQPDAELLSRGDCP